MEHVHGTRLLCCEMAVVGAGAAGFAAAIAGAANGVSVVLFNSHPRLGLKILMSGGTRCNVTHDHVSAASYHGSSRNAINLVLKAFPAGRVRAWFEDMGVALKIEPGGKLFPVSDSAETVLDALVRRATSLGVEIRAGTRVESIALSEEGFQLETRSGPVVARSVVLSTGGLSYPRTGSDGTGYRLAQSLGHSIVPLTPALTPLLLEGDLHRNLQGITMPAALTLNAAGRRVITCAGSLLFTHFGLSGPAALDMSRHWLRTTGEPKSVTAHFVPGEPRPLAEGGGLMEPDRAERPGGLPDRASLEKEWLETAISRPRTTVQGHFAGRLPSRFLREIAARVQVDPAVPLARVTREARRDLLGALTEFPRAVSGVVGYRKAEVTAGGVPLEEIDPRRMASRATPGLFLAGEILDVDGRLGGYNFQWAWSSGFLAGRSAAEWSRNHLAPSGDRT
jgi:predicted flavoprotein YhiN